MTRAAARFETSSAIDNHNSWRSGYETDGLLDGSDSVASGAGHQISPFARHRYLSGWVLPSAAWQSDVNLSCVSYAPHTYGGLCQACPAISHQLMV
jgi:hypothetical protein